MLYRFFKRMPPSLPSTFLSNELERALSEQSFGTAAFTMDPSSSAMRATASVTLLEGNTIKVSLSSRGYRMESDHTIFRWARGKTGDTIFETIEELLQSVSKLYERKRQQVLISKLENLS